MASRGGGKSQGRTGILVLWAIGAIVGLPDVAWSSCPATGSMCAAYERATLVVVADVQSVQPDVGPTRAGVVTHVQFRILRGFKGSLGRERDLSLNPSSEEFSYVKGQRVLVYADRVGKTLSTACTRTRQVSLTDSEVLALLALHEQQDGGVIDGGVATRALLRAGRARDVRVVLRREGAVISEMRTDVAGRFQTGWLTPGTYVLSVPGSTPGAEVRREVVVPRELGCISLGSIVDP
jgi:hypothetical protein